jgi:hypothetical protein
MLTEIPLDICRNFPETHKQKSLPVNGGRGIRMPGIERIIEALTVQAPPQSRSLLMTRLALCLLLLATGASVQ